MSVPGSWHSSWSGPVPCCSIVFVVYIQMTVLKSVLIHSAWQKTYIMTPSSTFYDARKLSYTLKWPWTMLLKLFLLLVYIEEFWNLFQSTQHGQKHISGHQDQPSMMPGSWFTPWSGPGPCCWYINLQQPLPPCSRDSKMILLINSYNIHLDQL